MEDIQVKTSSEMKKFTLFICVVFFSLNMAPVSLFFGLVDEGLIQFVSTSFFGIKEPVNFEGSGSGDQLRNYIELFNSVWITLIVAPLLYVIFRKNTNYERLYYWFTVYLRYYLATVMMVYGYAKLFKGQFHSLGLDELLQSYGNSSPMGLAWRFMGHSDLYCWFTGLAEVIAGFLLFFRKTLVLGALLTIAVMLNVFIMNLSYDIPVKIFSAQLIVLALYLLGPYFRQITDIFIKGKESGPLMRYTPVFEEKWERISRRILKSGYIILVTAGGIFQGMMILTQDNEPEFALHGIYHVKKFVRNGAEVPPLATDSLRWKSLVISKPMFGSLRFYSDSIKWVRLNIIPEKNKLEILSKKEPKNKLYDFTYLLAGTRLILNGSREEDSLHIEFERFDERNFRLVKRGFHWINEFPYNR